MSIFMTCDCFAFWRQLLRKSIFPKQKEPTDILEENMKYDFSLNTC